MSKVTLTDFFDFYSLEVIQYFAGKNSLNNENRSFKINEQYEKIVDKIYDAVRKNLIKAVVDEVGYIKSYKYNGVYKKIPSCRKSDSDPRFEAYLCYICKAFNDSRKWISCYGGKRWGAAAKMLLENPKDIGNKSLWVDRVLDLQHNTGHILNKHELSFLSYRSCMCDHLELNRIKENKYIPSFLTFKYKRPFKSIVACSSHKTRKIYSANKNLIPKAITA